MLSANIVNSNKKDNIQGNCFHIFYPDLHTAMLFDRDLSEPIIFGNKNIVRTHLKTIDKLMNVPDTTKVRIYSYILDNQSGYRRIDIYNGIISLIGKYIRKF